MAFEFLCVIEFGILFVVKERHMTQIILNLPEKTIAQAQKAAETLKRPLEELLADMLTAVLPSISDAPEAMQSKLLEMTWMENSALWDIAKQMLSEDEQTRLQQFSSQENLSPEEETERHQLREKYGQITLLKARAYAILSLRGGKPLLQ